MARVRNAQCACASCLPDNPCRVRDTCIVVAVDEPPDEGLDQPLRLEKLANEVRPQQHWAAGPHHHLTAPIPAVRCLTIWCHSRLASAPACQAIILDTLPLPAAPNTLHAQVTYKRLQDTLAVLSKPGGSAGTENLPGLSLVDVMFGSRQPQFAAATPKWKANNTRLDDSQVCWRSCTHVSNPTTSAPMPGSASDGVAQTAGRASCGSWF
jgi:hypothetical protein